MDMNTFPLEILGSREIRAVDLRKKVARPHLPWL